MEQQENSFTTRKIIHAPQLVVFGMLKSVENIRQWWKNPVKGNAVKGGIIRFELEDKKDQYSAMHVDHAHPALVEWTVQEDTGYYGEWINTQIKFELEEINPEICLLNFTHLGLTPDLRSYEACTEGWEHYLSNLAQICEIRVSHATL